MDVEPHHLLGFNPFNLLQSAWEDILATKEGIVIDKIVTFIAAMTKTILSVVKNSEDWMTKVANLAAEKNTSPYYTEKGVRVENNEECFGGPNCKFCPHNILRRLLSQLHHAGVEGMAKKKEIPGKQPNRYSEEDLENQRDVLRLICPFFHRIVTDLDQKSPMEDGSSHQRVPEDYKFTPSDAKNSYLQTAFENALFQFLLSLDSHKQCMVGMDPEKLERFFNAFDFHHITASANVLLPTGDKNLIIQTMKTFEFANTKDLVSDKTFRSIFRAVVFETLKVRPLEIQDHMLWHFLYTHRDDPRLKPLFDTYWPFVENDDGNLVLKGDIDAMLAKMGLSASDVKSACNSDGYCGVTVANEFLEAVQRTKEKLLRARRVGGSEEDAVMADVAIATAVPVATEKEEDVQMSDDDERGAVEDEDMVDAFAGGGDTLDDNDDVSDEDDYDPRYADLHAMTVEELEGLLKLDEEWEEYCKNRGSDEEGSDEEVDHNEGDDDSDGGGDDNEMVDDNDRGFDYNDGGFDYNEGGSNSTRGGYDPLGPGNNMYIRDRFR